MGTIGGKLGCAVATMIAVVATIPLLFVWAWTGAHCEPVPQCRREIEEVLAAGLTVLAVVTAVTGLLFRWAVNAIAAKRDDRGASARFVIAACLAALITAGLVIAVLLDLFVRSASWTR